MKKQIIISAIIFASCINVSSQEWYQIGTEWYFNQQILLDYPAHGYVKYTVEKDTLVDSENAKMIIHKTYWFSNGDVTDIDTLFVREDNGQVFRWNGSEYILMYDFTLNQGDTLDLEVVNNNCDSISPIIVDSINILEIDGIQLDVQYLSYTVVLNNQIEVIIDKVIERIGRIEEFSYIPSCGIDIVPWGNNLLRCYVENEFSFRSDWWSLDYPDAPCDTTIDGSTDIELIQQDRQINLYPNPCTNFLNINHSSSMIMSVKMFNSSGQLLKCLEPHDNYLRMDIRTFESGIYNIVIETENHSVSRNLIKL